MIEKITLRILEIMVAEAQVVSPTASSAVVHQPAANPFPILDRKHLFQNLLPGPGSQNLLLKMPNPVPKKPVPEPSQNLVRGTCFQEPVSRHLLA